MSLILDALRKSEAERRRGQSPDLYASVPVAAPPRTSAWRHLPILAGGALVLVAVALMFRPGGTPANASRDASAGSQTPPGPDTSNDTAGVDDAPPAFAQRPPSPPPSAPAISTRPVRPAASPPPTVAVPVPDARAPASPAAPPVVAATLPPVPAQAPVAPAADALPPIAVLSPGERAALPPLKLSMHVWNESPAQRFAIVDGQRVVEGASLGGAVVAEIRRDGVVLDVNGRRVLLPRP